MSETDGFTFTWRIENFSMCPQKNGDYLVSPVFVVGMLEKSKWRLQLYPSGRRTNNCVSCFLQCFGARRCIRIAFEIIVFSADNVKLTKHIESERTFVTKSGWGWDEAISRDVLTTNKEDYLPNDVLTIKCNMWKIYNASETAEYDTQSTVCERGNIFETFLRKETFSNVIMEDLVDFREHFGSNRGSTRTNIKVRKKIVTWPIKNFSSLRLHQQLSIPIISSVLGVPSFYLTFYLCRTLYEDRCAQIEIRRKETDCLDQLLVNCKISVVNTLKNNEYFAEEKHVFEPNVTDDVWKFPHFIETSRLVAGKYFDTIDDVLLLRCELSFSRLGDVCHNEDVDITPHTDQSLFFDNAPNPFENEFKNFCRNGEFSDVELRVGDRSFKVHKIILSARSSYFSSLFNRDQNDEVKTIDISDLSPEVLDRMLAFMYTDKLEDLKPKDALELYSAACAYRVLPLRLRCSYVIKSMLGVVSVCDVLKLADLHHDDDLKDEALRFIRLCSLETFQSPEWKQFMTCNSAIASDVMYRMLTENNS